MLIFIWDLITLSVSASRSSHNRPGSNLWSTKQHIAFHTFCAHAHLYLKCRFIRQSSTLMCFREEHSSTAILQYDAHVRQAGKANEAKAVLRDCGQSKGSLASSWWKTLQCCCFISNPKKVQVPTCLVAKDFNVCSAKCMVPWTRLILWSFFV